MENIANKTIELAGTSTTVSGYIKWEVINSDGTIDKSGEHKNLILDAGLDQLAQDSYANMFKYTCVGTGNSTPIVTQIGLDNETARTNAYLTSPGGSCGTTYSGNTFILQRTFNWPSGSLNGTYYELGFSWSATPGNNLWSRSLFKDSGGTPIGVTVTSAQQLRIVYQLSIVYGSSTWQDGSVNITGIGAVPYKYRAFQPFCVNSNGSVSTTYSDTDYVSSSITLVAYNGGNRNGWGQSAPVLYGEPFATYGYLNSQGYRAFYYKFVDPVYPDNTSWPALNALSGTMPSTQGVVSYTNSAYVNGTFYYDRTVTMDVNTANGDIQWILTGFPTNAACPDVYYFPTPISKDNLHTLTLVFRQSWGRA